MTDTVRVPMSRQEARLAAQSGVVAWLSGYKQEYRAPHDTLCDLIADAMLAASPQGDGSSGDTHPPQPDAQGWRDIATAPEKTDLLVSMTHSLGDGEWENIQWVDFWLPGPGWVHYRDRIDIPFAPTHWMPLPPPPSAHPAPIKPSGDTGELRERLIVAFLAGATQGVLSTVCVGETTDEMSERLVGEAHKYADDLIQSERAG